MKRRRFAIGLAVATAAWLTAACQPAGDKAAKAQVLHVYNWALYIDPALLKEFTAETGIKVVYDTFDSSEALEAKVLTGGAGYDLVVPPNSSVPRYIQAGAIAPLDPARTPNVKNLWPKVMTYLEPTDPGRRYSIPYMWGTIGIGYNRKALEQRLPGVAIDSWKVVFEPANLAKLKDCGVHFVDAPEDLYGIALNYLGKDPNSTDLADYAAATKMLGQVKPYVRKFHSAEYISALANGDICVAIGWSGDVLQAANAAKAAGGKVEIAYALPREGTMVWFDVFVMPKDAPNPDAAYRFLDYMLRPEVIARASNHTHYANANSTATALVDPALRNDPSVYPTPDVFQRLFVIKPRDQALMREVNRSWTQVKTGQ